MDGLSVGGGDWRRVLLLVDVPSSSNPVDSPLLGDVSGDAGAAKVVDLVSEGLRRCLCRYVVEEADRGKLGLGIEFKAELECCWLLI